MMTYMGFKIVVNDVVMSETKEDWSNVRSQSRAKRRLKYGYKQNIRYMVVPKTDIVKFKDTLVMHSKIYAKLMKEADSNGRLIRQNNYTTSNLSL